MVELVFSYTSIRNMCLRNDDEHYIYAIDEVTAGYFGTFTTFA